LESSTLAYNIAIDARKLSDFGIGTYVRNLVTALGELDQENQYVLFAGQRGSQDLLDLPDNFRVVVERSPSYSARELVALSWRLFRLRLDLYHSTHYVLPAVVPCRAVVTIHDIIHLLYPEFLPSALAFFYAQRMIRRSLSRGDRIIAVSQNTKTDLMDYFKVDGRKIRVVYSGVTDRFRQSLDAPEISAWLEEFGIDRPYLLFVGNPKPHKNLDNVVKAYAKALKIFDFDADLVCVGDREGMEFRIRQRAEQMGLGDRIRMVGHVPDEALPAIYQGATLFVFPTLYEGFGLPVIEAMASGLPVITSNTSALKEIAEGYGHLVNPLDVDEIANAIAQCMADDEHRQALVKLGLKRADDFQWSRTAEKTLEVYRAALQAPRGRSTIRRKQGVPE
jgi:glycosyltransferase involved in cell wall biosynthesis